MTVMDKPIATADDFYAAVKDFEQRPGYKKPAAFAVGIATFGVDAAGKDNGKVLDTYYPVVSLNENYGSAALLAKITGHTSGSKSYYLSTEQVRDALGYFAPFLNELDRHANVRALSALQSFIDSREIGPGVAVPRRVVVTFVEDINTAPVDTHDVYLRLHLLSYRKVKPRGQNLDGIFSLLNNVVWTDLGPFDPDTFEQVRLKLRAAGTQVRVFGVDKIPHMTDYVVPSGVRIADSSRVRLGAHLGDGTTVMQEGFANFNAGTLGKAMVEGRISAGVIVGDGSDVGGGASIMGTLSGGGNIVITIGENCLIGANAGTGISLGNNCTIQSGCYVTDNAKVKILPDGPVVKALDLMGKDDLRFWRNSVTGAIEVQHKKNETILNEALHAKQ
jgi:2,3,4,5-tetrahydropyridine-2-carboxylate N-succinyltransferase